VRRTKKKDKLSPLWSLPYRVTHVNGDGTVATLSSIATRKIRPSVHVQNCRIINPPVNADQAEDWERQIGSSEDPPRRKYLLASAPLLGGEDEEPRAVLSQQLSQEIISLDSDGEDTE
jgi:hypothetical protein